MKMADPTPKELEVLKQFRAKLSDLKLENSTDLELLRWLRARELNISGAEDMLRKHLQWRKDEDIDHILEWAPPPNFHEICPYEISGQDKEGRPILSVFFGKWDFRRGLGEKGMREVFLRYVDQLFAKGLAKTKENSVVFGKEITQCILIVDFANFSFAQLRSFANVATILEAAKRFEANNPEILYQFYFINGFRVFQVFFAMLKPLFCKRTLAKLETYSTPDKWMPIFASRYDSDQLPVQYREIKGLQENSKLEKGGMTSVEILPGKYFNLEVKVEIPKSILSWAFETEAYDIGFAVHFGKDEVVKSKRYEANVVPVTGALTCEVPGTYKLHFDNTYSRMRGKALWYVVEVVEPELNGGSSTAA